MNVAKELARLERMSVGQLHERYAEVFGERPRSRHRQYLVRRILWRLQANAEGGLSERARRRAEELADIAEVRTTPPRQSDMPDCRAQRKKSDMSDFRRPADARLPAPGAAITRRYRGRTVSVTVLPDGFEFEGERYKSLSAVAKAITGSHVNGYRFFGLGGRA